MSNNISIFSFNNKKIRTLTINGEPWFVLVDVCKILSIGNASQVKARLEDALISNEVIPDSLGRSQQNTVINEDGLYDCIFESKKPDARKFRKWVTSEVLPSIRKTGSYSINEPQYVDLNAENLIEIENPSPPLQPINECILIEKRKIQATLEKVKEIETTMKKMKQVLQSTEQTFNEILRVARPLQHITRLVRYNWEEQNPVFKKDKEEWEYIDCCNIPMSPKKPWY